MSSSFADRFASRRWLWLMLLIAALGGALFSPVFQFEFLNWDDDLYVEKNPWLQQGVNAQSLEWAFTANLTVYSRHAEYWSPLTLLSRLVDAQVFGIHAGWMHVSSAGWHLLNTALLAVALHALTGAWGRSACVALLFLVHPLNVEPVAWLSARKDLLAATFLFLTLLAYARYGAQPSRGRYGILLVAFLGALMAKPMAVSIPFILVLLDIWPLQRWQNAASRAEKRKLVVEKLPFFVLAGGAAMLAIQAQVDVGAMGSASTYPISARVLNAIWAAATYVRRMVWPSDLAIFYPHTQGEIAVPVLIGCGILLVAITGLVLWLARKRITFPLVGWFWFAVGIGPVIGLVQVGRQAMADRYFYTPGIGLFIIVVWACASLLRRPAVQVSVAAAAIAACAVVTHGQLATWENSGTAFGRALQVTERNAIAHGSLGTYLISQGRLPEAKQEFVASLKIDPLQYVAWNNLGAIEAAQGNDAAAIYAYERAVILDPASSKAHFQLGKLLVKTGRLQEARPLVQRAAELAPGWEAPKEVLRQLDSGQ